jgi:hypothetical protein
MVRYETLPGLFITDMCIALVLVCTGFLVGHYFNKLFSDLASRSFLLALDFPPLSQGAAGSYMNM